MKAPAKIAIFKDRRVLLGVTGSIAAYKAAEVASSLTQAGALVDVILSEAAKEFVSPLTFQSVTGRSAFTDDALWGGEAHVLHVGLAHQAQAFLIAPATANTIAKLAHGMADSLLTITALATRSPLLIAPAMDAGMFEHPATQANLETLQGRGVTVIGPAEGRMASGLMGMGRMVEADELVGHVRLAFARTGPLVGHKIVVTAGGTYEPIDPVRVIANRSSGKQGFAMAQAALDRGAGVTLISGPSALKTPWGAQRVNVETSEEMRQVVLAEMEDADALVMAAAVADFRPPKTAEHKIKRSAGGMELKLEPTPDILAEVSKLMAARKRHPVVVGFAAESKDLMVNAREKLRAKGLSLIVANDITAPDSGFAVDTNRVTILDAGGGLQELPLMSKMEVAEAVMERVVGLL